MKTALSFLLILPVMLTLTACGGGGSSALPTSDRNDDGSLAVLQCADGLDNDSDGFIDLADSGCSSSTDNDESSAAPIILQCADGIDNDSDGFIDLADSDCSSSIDDDESSAAPVALQCADGIDNDSDGLIDLADPGCVGSADDVEIDSIPPHNAVRANSYDDAWESAWVARAKTIIATPITGIVKTPGKVLHIGDSMTYSNAYGGWARSGAGATSSDQATINWLHATSFGYDNGWDFGTKLLVAWNNAGWGDANVDNLIPDARLNDAQFAVVMFNVPNSSNPADLAIVQTRVDQLIAIGIVPILSTIPPRKPDPGFDFNEVLAKPYNIALRAFAEANSLPIMDFYTEVELRRPNSSWIFTLIGDAGPPEDGVHPSGGVNGFAANSNPYLSGGDSATHTTGDATLNSGYLLRTWLTLQKMKEIKEKVVD